MTTNGTNINRYFYIMLVAVLILLPSSLIAQKNILKLYEPSSTVTLDSLHKVLALHSFINKETIKDTLVRYSYGDEKVVLGICPKSKALFSYWYKWEYSSTIDDEFTPKSKSSNKTYLEQSKQYYLNVCEHLKLKYGDPTSVVYQNGMEKTITYEKNQLDTLNINHLLNKECNIKVVWKNSDRKITLQYDNWLFSRSLIIYEYLNYLNQAQKNDEYASIKQRDDIIEIVKWTVLGLVTLLLFYAIYRYIRKNHEKRKMLIEKIHKEYLKEEEKKVAKQKRLEEQRKLSVANHNNYVSSLVEKYGSCDKRIRLTPKDSIYISEILVFSQSKYIVIDQKELLFSDILDCIVNDDFKEKETVQTYRGNSTATSKTNTGNMIGRTVVGGVLLGGTGAIIGGSTAKRSTVIKHGPDTSIYNKEVEHDYTVSVTIKDIKNPSLLINVGNNTKLKDDIVSLLKVIISVNKDV